MYAIVDCNSFYVSCERAFRPDLVRKPIIVLSNNDGCVVSRSDEAKALGIPMGTPAFKYKTVFKEQQVQVFSSNYSLYGDMSSRVMEVLRTFSSDVEVYSIDEAFLKLDLSYKNMQAYGLEIKKNFPSIPIFPLVSG